MRKVFLLAFVISLSVGCHLTKTKPSRILALQANVPHDMKNAEDDPALLEDSSVIVSIGAGNRLLVGDKVIDKEALPYSIEEALKKQPGSNKIVYLGADYLLDYGSVAEALRRISENNVTRVGLVVLKPGTYDKPQRLLVSIPSEVDVNDDL